MSIDIKSSSNQVILNTAQKAFSNDGRLDDKEAKQLKSLVNSSTLSKDIKTGVLSFLEKTEVASSGIIFGRDISSKELTQLKQLVNSSGDNPIAKKMLDSLEVKLAEKSTDNTNKYKNSSKDANLVSFSDKKSDKIKEFSTVKTWHIEQFSEYDKKYGAGSYFKDHDVMYNATGGKSPKASLTGKEADWRQAFSSCGPTSLKMVLTSKGINAPDLAKIREVMHEEKYGATDADNVVSGLKKLSNGQLSPKKINVNSDAKAFSDALRNEIKNGKMPIMLSSYISDNSAPSGGHFMVVTGVKPDGSISVADPYSTLSTRDISFDKLKESFDYRKANPKKDGDNNVIIST